ncbi:MAG: hypothetical protein CME19_24935 [Gemmatimonadetes bacterium]|nr:hypothetical protein [Gemmatimonadota bacterium]MBS14818.1 hypothetical protein [Gemmatimonadota bacterium]
MTRNSTRSRYVSSDDPPTLPIHGSEDDPGRSEELRDALQAAWVTSELFLFLGSMSQAWLPRSGNRNE